MGTRTRPADDLLLMLMPRQRLNPVPCRRSGRSCWRAGRRGCASGERSWRATLWRRPRRSPGGCAARARCTPWTLRGRPGWVFQAGISDRRQASQPLLCGEAIKNA